MSCGLMKLVVGGSLKHHFFSTPCITNTDEYCTTVPEWLVVWRCLEYPLVNIQKTMENHHFERENPL